MELRFQDRREAGQYLARGLADYAWQVDTIVLALTEASIQVAAEIAQTLGAPLDIFSVRELTAPLSPGTPFGVATSGGMQELDETVIRKLALPESFLQSTLAWEHRRLERRERILRGERPALNLRGNTVIVVDDGLASGSAIRGAIHAVRSYDPASIVVATPVAHPEVCSAYLDEIDDFACLIMPHSVWCADLWYEDEAKCRTEELRRLLDRAAHRPTLVRGMHSPAGVSAD